MVSRARRRSFVHLVGLVAFVLGLGACGSSLPPAAERPIPRELAPAARETARRIPLDGASNLRDLGGYTTRDGRRLRWGALYRSDALGDLSDEDVATLARLDLARVVDFRSVMEREDAPDRLPAGPTLVLRPIEGEGLDPRELRDRILAGEATGAELADLLVVGNQAFVTEFAPVYRAFLLDLADPATLPTLFHCTAGKDRAGFAAALALIAAGVPRDTVMSDYLLTNGYTQEKTERMLTIIRFASLFRADPDSVRPLFEARRGYLQAAFDTIDEKYADTDTYLRDGLGIDDATRDRIAANLLE